MYIKEKTCAVSKKCSGCQLSNMSYEKQLKWKHNRVYRLLRPFGTVKKIVAAEEPYHYRNKQQFVFRKAKNGAVVCGLYQSKTDGVVECFDCLVNDKQANEIAKTTASLVSRFGISIYSDRSGRGNLRHMLIRTGRKSGEIMIALVCAQKTFLPDCDFIKALTDGCPNITTVVEIVNKAPRGIFLDGEESVLYGRGYIYDELCGLKFKISAKSFYQINPAQTERLYSAAIERCGQCSGDRLLDAYSGVGTIGLIAAAKTGARVSSVELNREAHLDALENARLNGIDGISFVNDDARRYVELLAEQGERFDCVIADPPRAGCSREFLASLLKMRPKKIVYISCNPQTLQRDMFILTKRDYKAEYIRPFDMFPFTNHVECVVVLVKNGK